jgi:3-oxoacyl-[acyl-carrier protein] reductase
MSSESLRGKTAVVTGASSGIGRAIAEKFGRAGAHVYLAGRTAEPMEESKRRIESDGGKATIW